MKKVRKILLATFAVAIIALIVFSLTKSYSGVSIGNFNIGTVDDFNWFASEHSDEFSTKTENEENTSNNTNNTLDNDKFLEYKLGLLENVKDRKTYTIEFSLNKNNENKKWVLDSLTNQDIEKIHGLYQE